jgi:hypothetical protein
MTNYIELLVSHLSNNDLIFAIDDAISMNKAHHSVTEVDTSLKAQLPENQRDLLNRNTNLEMIDPKNNRLFNKKARIWYNVSFCNQP